MSRLRYPFTEISARCRLCGAVGLTASSEHALGGRLIEWRRAHAPVCPEWPRWAANKGLRLDDKGALLYPNEDGPYVPRVRPKADGNGDGDADDDLDELEALLAEVTNGAAPPAVSAEDTNGAGSSRAEDANAVGPASAEASNGAAAAIELPLEEQAETHVAAPPARRTRKPRAATPPPEPEPEPRIDLMRVPAEDLLQAELF
jgi:hypothetical protein